MRYVCGECGSDDATAAGCRKCYRAAFDMDTPLGREQMGHYRALCTQREVAKVGVWAPWAVYGGSFVLILLVAHLFLGGGDDISALTLDLLVWVSEAEWCTATTREELSCKD